MRLTRPTLINPTVVTSERTDLPNNLFTKILENDITAVNGTETIAAGQFMLLPQSFGNIYLGETFSSYICVHNCTPNPVQSVSVKVRIIFGCDTIMGISLLKFDLLFGVCDLRQICSPIKTAFPCRYMPANPLQLLWIPMILWMMSFTMK